MTAPRMTAKEKADRAPIATCYGRTAPPILGRHQPQYPDPALLPPPEWTIDGWKIDPRCAIVGPCLTGAHTTPVPEPVIYSAGEPEYTPPVEASAEA